MLKNTIVGYRAAIATALVVQDSDSDSSALILQLYVIRCQQTVIGKTTR